MEEHSPVVFSSLFVFNSVFLLLTNDLNTLVDPVLDPVVLDPLRRESVLEPVLELDLESVLDPLFKESVLLRESVLEPVLVLVLEPVLELVLVSVLLRESVMEAVLDPLLRESVLVLVLVELELLI